MAQQRSPSSETSKASATNKDAHGTHIPTSTGIQWDSHLIFEENAPAHPHATNDILAPNALGDDDTESLHAHMSVLDVPMLPGVTPEPVYRQQRSLSFSMGQDPAFFGYNDYDDEDDDEDEETNKSHFKSNLETMAEEEEGDDTETRFRSRSKSSGAAFSLLSPSQQSRLFERIKASQTQTIQEESATEEVAVPESSHSSSDLQASHPNTTHPSSTPYNPIQHLTEQLENMQLLRGHTLPPYPTSTPASYHLHPHPHPHHADHFAHMPLPPPGYVPASFMPPVPLPQMQPPPDHHESGKGVALHRLNPHTTLYLVEFKAERTDFFYAQDPNLHPCVGDLVIVEADRGEDLGKVARVGLSPDEVTRLQAEKPSATLATEEESKGDLYIKRIIRLATPDETNLLLLKSQDEQRALVVCKQKTRQRKLPMEVVDAEYQWDRRKLTYYFVADRRIDFRELVRELFKIYKTRIWMCAVPPKA